MRPVLMLGVLLSATLLFAVQPLAGRVLLPVFGGSPSVWNTAMVVFQMLLLAGYALAHLIATRAPMWAQVVVVAAVFALGFALWPEPESMAAAADRLGASTVPSVAVLASLATTVGPAFLGLAMVSPLLQRWWARSGGDRPTRLYAASNLGSMLGLLGYPFLVEPTLALGTQASACSAALAVAALVVVVGGALVTARRASTEATLRTAATGHQPITWSRRLRWVGLAAVPSALLLGSTRHITSDVAPVPLLWVVPLAIYLLTFVVAFGGGAERWRRWCARVWPVVLVAIVASMLLNASGPVAVLVPMHLLGLAVGALLCHAGLAADAPEGRRLTEFYLWLAIGGALGGTANALLAPVLFDSYLEYPIALAAVCLALPRGGDERKPSRRGLFVRAAAVAMIVAAVAARVQFTDATGVAVRIYTVGLPCVGIFLIARYRYAFSVAVASALLLAAVLPDSRDVRIEHRERTFFGVHTVDISDGFRRLRHGSTVHGLRSLADDPPEPLAYYSRRGPCGDVFRAMGMGDTDAPPRRVLAIGLGVGAIAAYARADDAIDFIEIDPEVVRIAEDVDAFGFLHHAAGDVDIAIGDGRRLLAEQVAGGDRYDLVVVDAFSSDAIPMHLLTAEAFELYRDALEPGGLIAVHISNRHLALGPVVAAAGRHLGMAARHRVHRRSEKQERETGVFASEWAVLAAEDAEFGLLARSVVWPELPVRDGFRLWTDDFSSLFSVFRWK